MVELTSRFAALNEVNDVTPRPRNRPREQLFYPLHRVRAPLFFDRVAAKISLFQQVNRSSFRSVLNLFETTATIICSTPPPPSVHCPPSDCPPARAVDPG